MLGFFKSVFRKESNLEDLSAEELNKRITAYAPRQKELRDLLGRAGLGEGGQQKSVLWQQQLTKKIEDAVARNDYEAILKLEAELAEARKRMKKIDEKSTAMTEELNAIEDDIELLSRALVKK